MTSANQDTEVSEWPSEILESVKQDQLARDTIRQRYPELFEAVSSLMFQHDSIGINFTTNADEYEPEVGTVIPRLANCSSVDDVVTVLHEEFVRWFGSAIAGASQRYAELANDIRSLWLSVK